MFRDGQVFHRSLKEGRALAQPQQTAAAAPLHHDPHITTGQAKDLFYIGDGTDMIEVLLAGLFHREVALSYQENGQPLAHRLVQGLD